MLFNPFIHLLTPLGNKPFENTMGKGEIARNEQFLLFPQCFLPVWIIFFHFLQICKCRLQTFSVWKSLKFVWYWVKTTLPFRIGSLCSRQINGSRKRNLLLGRIENTDYQHFLLFPQCFSKNFFPRVVKSCDCVVKGNPIEIYLCYR